ncbi:MAG: 4Fe-4S dicluster domain-containing protein [Candidatus Hodarchaeota archaeon]
MSHLRELRLPERTVNIEIDSIKCVGPFDCGECLKKCPATVFITYPKRRSKGKICEEWLIVTDDVFCWGCGACIKVCPNNAITISEIK